MRLDRARSGGLVRAALLLAGAVAASLAPARAQAPTEQSFQGQQLPNNTFQSPLQNRPGFPTVPFAPRVQTVPQLIAPDRTVSRQGELTQAEGGPVVQGPLGDAGRPAGASAIFGASLFTRDAIALTDAPNPNYVIVPNDRISVRIWGAVEGETMGIVDPTGNLFIPNLGPIRIAGTRAGDLQRVIETEVKRTYTDQVQVYATLLSIQRIGVFVTGFVRTPGRFGGSAADSVIDFLVRSGGVDPARGSYRDIRLERGGRQVATIDLYQFLLEGRLPQVRLQEGDTIVVGRQRAVVGADGAVRNNYLFEVPGRVMTGRELIEYSRPLPSATNAVLRGTRNGQPFSRYASLAEFAGLPLGDQDQVTFITDAPARTVRVTVEGSRIGPSVLVADRDAQICQLLDYIAVDPLLADTRSVFILRQSVAAQQRRAIDEALDRLERQLFMAVSATTGVAAIRASEAQLVSSYIQRGRRTQPEGRVVVMDNGRCLPLRVEDGDVIVVPERAETVMVAGEVTAPRAVVWRDGMRIQDFVRAAGGFTPRGASSQMMIRRASGELVLEPTAAPQPGDELIALPRLDPKIFQIGSDLLGLIYQIAVATRIFT